MQDQIRASGLRLTRARIAILSLLRSSKAPLTIQQIFDRLSASKSAPDWATVFRSVQAFDRAKILRSFRSSDGVHRYETTDVRGSHHHHIQCLDCGKVEHLSDCSEALDQMVRPTGFSKVRHTLEFEGICPRCS